MIRRAVLTIAACLAASAAIAQQHGTPQEASWRVQVVESARMTAYGSATAINPQLAVTAAHVVDGRRGVAVTLYRPDGLRVTAHSIAADTASDVALLELDAGVRFVAIGADPKLGETITAYGYGRNGVLRTWAPGQVERYFGRGEFESTLTIESGDSGMGMFNAAGELVGVNSAAANASHIEGGVEGHSIASPASAVLALARQTAQTACPGGVCTNPGIFNGWFSSPAPAAPAAPINRGVPVQPFAQPPSQPQPLQPAPIAAADPRVDNHEQRLQALEGWANGLKRIADSYPITQGKVPPLVPISSLPASPAPTAPAAPAPPPAPQAPAADIGAIVQPIVSDAAAQIKDQIASDIAKLKAGQLTPADVQDSINATGSQIIAGVKSQVAQNPQAIAAAVEPFLAGAVSKAIPATGALAGLVNGPLGAAAGVLLTSALAGLLSKLFGSKTPAILPTPIIMGAPPVQVANPPTATIVQTQPAGNEPVQMQGPDLLGEAYRQAVAKAAQFGKTDLSFVEALKNQILAGLKGQAQPVTNT